MKGSVYPNYKPIYIFLAPIVLKFGVAAETSADISKCQHFFKMVA